MKLASLKGGRDGRLVVVDSDLARYVAVPEIAPTMQQALDEWMRIAPRLRAVSDALNAGMRTDSRTFRARDCAAPLPRAHHWADGSAYLHHAELVRRARGAELPARFLDDPLIYQGGSDILLGPCDPIEGLKEEHGIDLEAEVAIVTDDVPRGISEAAAGDHIKLVMLANDISLRNLIPNELAKGFGFYQSKPPTAFSPVAATIDELGSAWMNAKLNLPLRVEVNGEILGAPNAGIDMQFSFARLIAHAAATRPLGPGTIVGSGTVSNRDRQAGSCCLAERRMIEIIEQGEARTPFLKIGDHIRIEMRDARGQSIFGAIDQRVEG